MNTRFKPATGFPAGSGMPLSRAIRKYRWYYILMLPGLLYFILFQIVPYSGLMIVFKDYSPVLGILKSDWVGLKHFNDLFSGSDFSRLLANTLLISAYKLIFSFPVPIVFALLLNEVRNAIFKRTVQTITYFPHFLSWVVFGGIMVSFLTPSGVINGVLQWFGLEPINFLAAPPYFRTILVATDALKTFGWGAIIYLAALTGIDTSLYDAAKVDGAGRWKQMMHITLPGLSPTIVLMFIIQLGHVLEAGFEQVYVMSNPSVYSVADIIDTYVYRMGLGKGNFSLATAVGMFQGIVGFILILSANTLIRKLGQRSLW